MTVNALNNVQSNSEISKTSNSKTMGKDEFLTLLVAQLQAQDPLNPMDGTEFTAQLAQFSSLEQLQNINGSLKNIGKLQSSLSSSQAVDYIGKQVTAKGNTISVKGDDVDPIRFNLKTGAKSVYIKIYDSAGNFIRGIETKEMNKGIQTVKWDGKNKNGVGTGDGNYKFEVLAVDTEDNMISTETFATGEVTGVRFEDGAAFLVTKNKEFALSSIVRIDENN